MCCIKRGNIEEGIPKGGEENGRLRESEKRKTLKIKRLLLDVNTTSSSTVLPHPHTHSHIQHLNTNPLNQKGDLPPPSRPRSKVLTKQPGVQVMCESGRQVTMLLQTADFLLRRSSLGTRCTSAPGEVRQVSPAARLGQVATRHPGRDCTLRICCASPTGTHTAGVMSEG